MSQPAQRVLMRLRSLQTWFFRGGQKTVEGFFCEF